MTTLDDYLAITDGDTRNVRLFRPGGANVHYDWVVDYEGPVAFGVEELPPVKRGPQARPAGHKAFYIQRPDGEAWADYTTCNDYDNGKLLAEDYLLELM